MIKNLKSNLYRKTFLGGRGFGPNFGTAIFFFQRFTSKLIFGFFFDLGNVFLGLRYKTFHQNFQISTSQIGKNAPNFQQMNFLIPKLFQKIWRNGKKNKCSVTPLSENVLNSRFMKSCLSIFIIFEIKILNELFFFGGAIIIDKK